MKKDTAKYEEGKKKVYNNVLGIIGGCIILWLVLYFVPMDNIYSLVKSASNSSNIDTIIASFFATVIAMGFLCFSFGFYGIKSLINVIAKNRANLQKNKQIDEEEVTA